MEQQIRAWLRYSIVLGLYVSPTEATPYIHNSNHCPANTSALRGERQMWLKQRQAFQRERLKRIYLRLLMPLLCVLYVNGLLRRKPVPGTMLSWTVATIFFSSQALSNFLLAGEALWRQQEHETLLRLLHEIELSLKLRLRQDVRLDWLLPRVRWLLRYLLWTSVLFFVLFVYNFVELQYIGYFWYSIWFAIAMRLRLIQLLIYVRVLQHYLECLSMKLSQLVAYRVAPSRQLMDVNYARLQSLEYLVAIKEIYDLLFKAFQQLNDFAGWSLFSIILCYMLDYGCTLYWSLLSWEGYLERRNYYIACFWWLLPMSLITWHICHLCHSCRQLVSCSYILFFSSL